MIRATIRWAVLGVFAALPVAGWLAALRICHDGGLPAGRGPSSCPIQVAPRSRRLAAGIVDLAVAQAIALLHPASWLLAALFLCYRDSFGGGGFSPGKRLLGLSVDGASPGSSIARNLSIAVLPVAAVVLPVEALAAWRDPLGRRISDRIAGTAVVLLKSRANPYHT